VGEDPELGDVPNAARMYDYYLGGAANFAVDREFAQRALERFPHTAHSAQANRSFLRRAVRWCVQAGIDQFLDLGSGVPTVGNVHEVARELDPAARVVYVDVEPVAVSHARALLGDTTGVAVAHADLRDPVAVLGSPQVRENLDLTRPVAMLLVAVLHFVADADDPAAIVAAYTAAAAPGSALVISHVSDDQPTEADAAPHRAVAEVYRNTTTPAYLRDRNQIRALFGEARLIDPGLVDATCWYPSPPGARSDEPSPRAEGPDHSNPRRCGFYGGLAQIG
jgi:hypothetical protein